MKPLHIYALLLCSVALLFNWRLNAQSGSGVSLEGTSERLGKPSEYVTLAFTAKGTGEYTFTLEAPENWQPLSNNRTVTLEGSKAVNFTVQVPPDALADQVVTFKLRAEANGQVQGAATTTLRVAAVGGVQLRAPDEIVSQPNQPAELELFVTNTGNKIDTFQLEAVKSLWPVAFNPPSFSLPPRQTKSVKVRLEPQGEVGAGFIYVLRIKGVPSLDVDAGLEASVLFRFGMVRRPNDVDAGPQLVLNASVSVQPSLVFPEAGDPVADVAFGVTPGLGGELSDYTRGNLDISGGFRGSLRGGLTGTPNGIGFGLRGVNWDTALRFGGPDTAFSLFYRLSDWRVGGTVNYQSGAERQRFTLNAEAVSLDPNLNLQTYGSFSGSGDTRSDVIGANYQTRVSENVELGAGGTLTGSGALGEYNLGVGLNQSVRFQNQDFDVLQSYSGAPLAGQHGLAVFVGLRSLAPFGARFGSSLGVNLSDQLEFSWRNTLVLSVTPLPNLSLVLTSGYSMQTTPRYLVNYTLNGLASYNFSVPGVLLGGVSAGVNHLGVINGNANEENGITLSGSINAGNLRFSASGGFQSAYNLASGESTETTKAGATISYLFSSATSVALTYGYNLVVSSVAVERHDLALGWTQSWDFGMTSTLSYGRFVQSNLVDSTKVGDSLSLGVAFRDVLLEGATLSLGWKWSSNSSIFDPSLPSTHEFSLGFGFNLSANIATPAPVVDLFGGRKSGELRGVAFVDRNLNGKLDQNEPRLTKLRVRLGRDVATTNDQGVYSLRAQIGTFKLDFPEGLEAGYDLLGEREETVRLNETRERDLPFAPVVPITVRLFDDLNRNGRFDDGEPGIPYGGVRLEGPLNKTAKVDGDGVAVISGLVSGKYSVFPDAARLPDGYQATTQVLEVNVQTPNEPAPVLIGAAIPPRQQELTYESGSLAVFAVSDAPQLPPGADWSIEALVQGEPTRVTARGDGFDAPFENRDGRWFAVISLPEGLTPGNLTVTIEAERQGQTAKFDLDLLIKPGALFEARTVEAIVGTRASINVQTLYKIPSGELELRFPDGSSLKLQSEDGYAWRGEWPAPTTPGETKAKLVHQTRELGTITFRALAPKTMLIMGPNRGFDQLAGWADSPYEKSARAGAGSRVCPVGANTDNMRRASDFGSLEIVSNAFENAVAFFKEVV
jgi:hypothetical protein